jgi:hypothetical protein
MRRFWKRDHHHDPVERLLRNNRPQPHDEYVARMLEHLKVERRPIFRPHGLGRRVLLAAVVTALAFGAAVAAGGVQSASSGITGLVDVAKKSVSAPGKSNGDNGNASSKGQGKGTTKSTTTTIGGTTAGDHSTTTASGNNKSGNDNTGSTSNNKSGNDNTGSTSNGKSHGNDNTGSTSNGKNHGNDSGNHHPKGSDDEDSGEHQYSIAVCHHTSSAKNPWIEIHVSPQGAANLVIHHKPDYIIGTTYSTCPPPSS